jgi:hypothetical protein
MVGAVDAKAALATALTTAVAELDSEAPKLIDAVSKARQLFIKR